VYFNLYVQQFKIFILEGSFWGVHHLEDFGGQRFAPLEDPLICSPEIPLNMVQIIDSQTINLLHYEFQTSMLSSSKISLWESQFEGRGLPPKDPQIWSKQLSHKQLSYITSFKLLC